MKHQELDTNISQILPYLENFALSLTKDNDKASDLIQDTLLRIVTYADRFQQGTNFKAWSTTIMRNSFINDYRRNRSIQKRKEQNTVVEKEQLTYNEGETHLNYEIVLEEVYKLNELYYVPFNMFLEGYHYNEIAEELHVPLGTVKSRIFCARKILRKQLAVLESCAA
ncbi:MAG: RNA polymerase sigma factor [Saprospiraceae bacterium]|nr:MAG: RNA polymerase sigma factor [Saprospiraceae bacterium]